MKKENYFSLGRKMLLTLCISLGFSSMSFAQQPVGLPTCTGYSSTLLYYISGNQIYNYDPCLPFSGTNPQANTISGAAGGDGLALGANIYAAAPAIHELSLGFSENAASANRLTLPREASASIL